MTTTTLATSVDRPTCRSEMRATIARWPYLSALVAAVSPYAVVASTSQPASMSAVATSSSPAVM
jgi:hypothetical protein